MKILTSFKRFLQKSIFSSPDDIEKPHHKIANLLLKTISIGFVVLGLWLHIIATHLYIKGLSEELNNIKIEEISNQIIMLNLFGIGFTLIGIFIAAVLLVRYIAFTLPDRIYLRCYAPEKEKNKKI